MIFVFAEDSSLEVVGSLEEAERNYEGVDVEGGVFTFFDESGAYLKPEFTTPNRSGRRLLGIFKLVESGKYRLRPSPESDKDISSYLSTTALLEPNPWFKNLEEVSRFLQARSDS
ncbi:MAG: hypothetical protein LC746_05185 [Acidobacteria bacterium]|nr:hypothetical protein [Acidobacteriota bacterium]